MTENNNPTPVEEAEYRANLYGLLAVIFRGEPNMALLDHIRSAPIIDAFSEFGVEFDPEFVGTPMEELLESLLVEHTRLFYGPGPHISPHESVHHQLDGGKWGTLWGDSTVEVQSFIENIGLNLMESSEMIPDHISVELELMQALLTSQARALEKGLAGEAEEAAKLSTAFFNDHLSKWAVDFFKKVEQGAEKSFYRQMARFAMEFIKMESENI